MGFYFHFGEQNRSIGLFRGQTGGMLLHLPFYFVCMCEYAEALSYNWEKYLFFFFKLHLSYAQFPWGKVKGSYLWMGKRAFVNSKTASPKSLRKRFFEVIFYYYFKRKQG